jgi:hypothetical protein
MTKNNNQNSNVWISNNKKNKDHNVFTGIREKNKQRKKIVIRVTSTKFGEHVSLIMEEELTMNNLRQWMIIFYN